ncbi:tRNA (adenosine(37)-N6)-dimethylallyltransferase MiaA [Aureisphaera sp. CAU 1614]|uniref:tRNA dimethylallyltransferase n=1 Tax=Halomarinibacterium sedimenti TaxID=2857106 RepID=A0A9X1FPZ3_9FLAO|nr:tRNA (adenosine(37)-N6)-dimethylallyltransferase MiaA [Halomarinibacterium sedimenti]MBW2938385.1 tRNA (adenosine(37)-N6)-dimethylallyltransferase MiaA [Halomarinibacterium sedimenti]
MVALKPLLVCIVGPTAIGKTALSIKLANAFNTEIISADSRQFFKEMTIGTAVPTKEELNSAKHYFIQNKSISENYSVGDFERDAIELLEELFKKHQVVLMVGGSGLYVDAVVKGLDSFPEVPYNIRKQLKSQFEEKGIEYLQKQLKVLDPVYFEEVDIQNTQRVIRALEVCKASGKPFSSFRKNKEINRNFDTLYIGLTADREVIYERINQRVDLMIKDGLLKEVEKLKAFRHLNALQTVGYRELFDYFDGTLNLEEAISEIKKNTRRFAKRQGTWFRKNATIEWFDYKTPLIEIENYIKKALSQ